MKELYEANDILNSPVEAFYYHNPDHLLPVPAHWHYFIELIYIYEGDIKITVNDEIFHLIKGDFLFIPPSAVHAIDGPSGKNFKYGVVKVDPNYIKLSSDYIPKLSTVFRAPSLQTFLPIKFNKSQFKTVDVPTFFDQNIYELDSKNYGYDTMIYTNIVQLFIELLRIWRDLGYSEVTDNYYENNDYSINNIIVYIDEHSSENIHVQTLADMCNMSYSNFAKCFKRTYKQSCKEYIEFVRLNKAENYLLFTNYDLNFISEETGFSDCSHLIRVFKRKYNITPKQFRLEHSKH